MFVKVMFINYVIKLLLSFALYLHPLIHSSKIMSFSSSKNYCTKSM